MPDQVVLALYVLSFVAGGMVIRQVALWLGFKKVKRNPHLKWWAGMVLVTILAMFATYELTVGSLSKLPDASAWLGRAELLWLIVFMVFALGLIVTAVVIPLVKFIIAMILTRPEIPDPNDW